MILYLYIEATSSIPNANSEKYGSVILGITTPTVVVFLEANPRATALGR